MSTTENGTGPSLMRDKTTFSREEIAAALDHLVAAYEAAGADVGPLCEAMLWCAFSATAQRAGRAAAVEWIENFATALRLELERPGEGRRYVKAIDANTIGVVN